MRRFDNLSLTLLLLAQAVGVQNAKQNLTLSLSNFLTSRGTLNPKPGLVNHLDSLFFKPPLRAWKIVGCFWYALSV